MYDAVDLLARIDRHPVALLGGLALAMAFQTLWLVNAIVVARRDRAYSIPVACTFLWFAHDIGFVVRLGYWQHTYGHWFLDLFWLGMLSAALLELMFFRQIVRYGRDELAPRLTRVRFTVLVAAGAIGVVIVWEYLRSIVNDPLYMGGSVLTLAAYALLGPAMYARRGGPRGQSVVMWLSFTAMTATWWVTTALGFPAAFHSPQYLVVGAYAFVVGVVMSTVVFRDRCSGAWSSVAPGSFSDRAERPAETESWIR